MVFTSWIWPHLTRTVKGISDTMLARCLHELMENGIIIKYETDEEPPRCLYTLSEAGKGLLPAMQCLFEWGAEHMDEEENRTVE